MVELAEIDLLDPDAFKDGPPFAWFSKLRKEQPVFWHDDPVAGEGEGVWVITRHKDVDYVSKNPKLFSSYANTCFTRPPADEMALALQRTSLINMDPPDHVRYRRIIRNAFTPRMVDSYEPHFREVVKGIIDRVAPAGRCEFVRDVASEMPLVAICELMGIPLEDRYDFFEWTNTMLGMDDPDLNVSEASAQEAQLAIFNYGRKLAEMHRKEPRDNLVGALLDGIVEGEHLTEDEFCNFFMLLIIAGNETTRTVTSQGMKLLIDHPDELRRLEENRELIPHAVEEFLRYNTAVIHFTRTATQDLELGGKQLRKGDRVMMFYHSANHDEEVFQCPAHFDVGRNTKEDVRNRHRAFGIGEHFCLGSHLARLQLRLVFSEIVGRLRNPQMDGELIRLRSNFINGIKDMPIRFDPEPATA